MFYYDKKIDWRSLAGVKRPAQLNLNQQKRVFDICDELFRWNTQEFMSEIQPLGVWDTSRLEDWSGLTTDL